MTTDEATKSEGEVQPAVLAERGEDITPARDRGVLKVRGAAGKVLPCLLPFGVVLVGAVPSPWCFAGL